MAAFWSNFKLDAEADMDLGSGFLAEAENPPHVWKARSFPNFGDLGQPGGGSFLSQTESGLEVPFSHYSHINKIRACQICLVVVHLFLILTIKQGDLW